MAVLRQTCAPSVPPLSMAGSCSNRWFRSVGDSSTPIPTRSLSRRPGIGYDGRCPQKPLPAARTHSAERSSEADQTTYDDAWRASCGRSGHNDTHDDNTHENPSPNGNGNGAQDPSDGGRRERAEQAKSDIDAASAYDGNVPHDTSSPEDGIMPRHPETPYTVLPPDVPKLAAEEIGDPIAKNVITAMLGKAVWLLAEAKAFGKEKGIEPLAQAVANVRKGAYVVQSKREGQSDLELIERTTHDVAALRVNGQADAQQAERVTESIPRAVDKLQAAVEDRAVAQSERDAALNTARRFANRRRLERARWRTMPSTPSAPIARPHGG